MNNFVYHYGNDNFGQTKIENIFINEFMPEANGDYIKVYLYGLKNSQNPDLRQLTTEELAQKLMMTESDVLRAWEYWKDQGIIEITENGADREIAYLNITEAHYNKTKAPKKTGRADAGESVFDNLVFEIERMYGGKPLTLKWNEALYNWYYDYQMEPGCILFAVEQTLENLAQKNTSANAQLNYASKIIKRWHKERIITYQDALLFTQKEREQNAVMYDVLKRLGLKNRDIMARERKIMKKWFDEYHFDRVMIIEAANRSLYPRIDYVDGILKRWKANGWKSPDEIVEQAMPRVQSQKAEESTSVDQERLKVEEEFERDFMASYMELVAEAEKSEN